MKHVNKSLPLTASCLIFLFALVFPACENPDEAFLEENVQASNNESTLESVTDELDDLARIALDSEEPASGGRIRGTNDNRLDCEGTTITFSSVSGDKTSGTATITFGPNGCTDNRGNVRRGTVVVTWSGGRWYQEGSSHTITLQNYSINGIGIDGTRSLTCFSVSGTLSSFTIQWYLSATHGFTWPDQSTANRLVNKTKRWDHSSGSDTFTISNGPSGDNAAEGTNRHGTSYTMTITTPLVYNASCVLTNKVFLPVSGVKLFTNVDTEKTMTLDFGDGTCDNTLVVSVEGASKTITVKNDGSD
jgi:hypothetical protein